MFESYESQKIYYTQSGRIQKKGHASNQKFDDTECIITPEYSVILDRSEREVVYSPKKMGFNYDDPGLAIDLDSLLRFCKSCQFKRISDKLASYAFRMLPGYPDYSQVIVQFNTENYLVQKIIFYCQEDDISTDNQKERMAKARIEINYKDLNTKPDLSATDFSYEKYLLRNSSEFKLKPELKNYHLTVLSF